MLPIPPEWSAESRLLSVALRVLCFGPQSVLGHISLPSPPPSFALSVRPLGTLYSLSFLCTFSHCFLLSLPCLSIRAHHAVFFTDTFWFLQTELAVVIAPRHHTLLLIWGWHLAHYLQGWFPTLPVCELLWEEGHICGCTSLGLAEYGAWSALAPMFKLNGSLTQLVFASYAASVREAEICLFLFYRSSVGVWIVKQRWV